MDNIFAGYFSTYLGVDLEHVNAGEVIVAGSGRRMQPEYGWGYTVAVWLLRNRVSVHNAASIRLAERVGYQRTAESIEWMA